ncbi:hypothetical protein Tco_0623557, partial [Tanacetum coccineum]
QVTILNTSDYLGKFEGKADEGYLVGYACFLSQLEPTSIAKALEDPDWVDVMQEEQTIVATSSTEAEYVAAASCCAQVLWIQ